MVTKEEALKLALDALEYMDGHYLSLPQQGMQALTAIKEALAQPAQEPVAWIEHHKAGDNLVWEKPNKGTPIFTNPPQRPWKGLTSNQFMEVMSYKGTISSRIARAEEILMENNT